MEKEYSEDQVKIAEKMLELAQYEYNSEYDRLDRFESKVFKILILSFIPITILAFQIYLIFANINISSIYIKLIVMSLSTTLLSIGTVFLLSLLRPEPYIRINLDTELNADRFNKTYGEVVYQIAINFKSYTETNRRKIDKNINTLKMAMRCIIVASLLILINYFI